MRILSGIQPSGTLHLNFVILGDVEKSLAVFAEPVANIQNRELRFFDSAQNDR